MAAAPRPPKGFASPLLLLLLLLRRPPTGGADSPIKHVVVLVLENRSFDHMLGWLKPSALPDVDGLTGAECNPPPAGRPGPLVCVSPDARYVDPDPDHSFFATRRQVYGGGGEAAMQGFVDDGAAVSPEVEDAVMKGFSPESVPVFAALAREFAVADRWFSSVPGPTQPNRLFVYSATSHGAVTHVKSDLARGYPQRTIFDSLHDNGVDFNIYFESAPTTLFYRNMRKLKYITKFHKFSTFMSHARDARLASLSVLEPRYFDINGSPANDDHPSHDVAEGQKLVKAVYESLRSSPQWNQSLLVITYDEHGGFYDHVPPPDTGVPSPDGIAAPAPFNFGFDRLGVRVPTLLISPLIRKGTVVRKPNGPSASSEFEHSSIPATVKKIFKLSSNFLTQRDAWAGTFEDVVSELTEPRTDCPVTLPDVAPLRSTPADEGREISEFQSEIVQLAAALTGDHFLSTVGRESGKPMMVKDAHRYVTGAVSRFIWASKQAYKMGANESAIVDMRASLTSRKKP